LVKALCHKVPQKAAKAVRSAENPAINDLFMVNEAVVQVTIRTQHCNFRFGQGTHGFFCVKFVKGQAELDSS
ncbi:MAG TPA: hypothetical protein VGE93_13905, partial [Bryobacteraceae bacterium]